MANGFSFMLSSTGATLTDAQETEMFKAAQDLENKMQGLPGSTKQGSGDTSSQGMANGSNTGTDTTSGGPPKRVEVNMIGMDVGNGMTLVLKGPDYSTDTSTEQTEEVFNELSAVADQMKGWFEGYNSASGSGAGEPTNGSTISSLPSGAPDTTKYTDTIKNTDIPYKDLDGLIGSAH